MGTIRIGVAPRSWSGIEAYTTPALGTVIGNPSVDILNSIINKFPLNSGWNIASTFLNGYIEFIIDTLGIYLDGSGTPIDENSLPTGFNFQTLNYEASYSVGTNGSITLNVYPNLGASPLPFPTPITLNGVFNSLPRVVWTTDHTGNPGTQDQLFYHQMTGTYQRISTQWVIENLTDPTRGYNKPGDRMRMRNSDDSDSVFDEVTQINLFPNIRILPPYIIQTKKRIIFIIPDDVTDDDDTIVTITGNGTSFSGDALVGLINVLTPNRSGIYSIILNQRHDTLYIGDGTNTTENVAIPNPFGKTGFLGG